MSGCDSPRSEARAPAPIRVDTAVLTADGNAQYRFVSGGDHVAIQAPADVGTNLRMIFWGARVPARTDETSCATWQSATTVAMQQVSMTVENCAVLPVEKCAV
jgi:hypothetical protein